jgi:hypothetical protein
MQKEFILITSHKDLKYINGKQKLSCQLAKCVSFF